MTKYKKSVGRFAKVGVDYKENDILTIANEGKEVEGSFGIQDAFLVKLTNGEEKNMSFNQTSINNMINSYGEDSVKWVGQKVKVWLILQNVQGKMKKVTYLSHPDAEVTDSGDFVIPGKDMEFKASEKVLDEDGFVIQ